MQELRFLLVNGTHAMLPYRQAALVEGGRVYSLSGTISVERHAPYVEWLERLSRGMKDAARITRIDARAQERHVSLQWSDWLPSEAVWIPLTDGALLLARDLPFTDPELALLNEWTSGWSHAMQALRDGRRIGWFPGRPSHPNPTRRWWLQKRWWFVLLLGIAASVPVPLTVLAPAELVPQHPEIVRAPLDAVIDRVHVQPNQAVRKGEVLLSFDERVLRGKISVATQALASAEAEYHQASQRAVADTQVKAQLATLAGRIEERRAELALAESQLARTRVVAQRDGLVLIDDPSSWSGKPVSVGERIMRIADPGDVEVETWVALHDLVDFPENSLLRVYLNADPLHPVIARVRYLSYEPLERPDGSYAYRMRATLEASQTAPRVGAKGTARIEAREVSVAYWLLRKPWAAARAFVGW